MPDDTEASRADWWRQAVVYQVYPRSFADSTGDGIGDIPGILSRVPYLAALGVDAVWVSPFYPSALADGGYDVDDYRDVDPRLGTLADFDDLVAALHAVGIKMIVDIVPNHSSNRHVWFQEALASPKGSPARDRYIFRDGLGPDGTQPPSDWPSHFGGSAWTRISDGQWYLHLFAEEQPDFDWSNPQVRAEFVRTLRFWADRGVDGFRVDVAHALAKDLSEPLRSFPVIPELSLPVDGSSPIFDREDVHTIFSEWRKVFDEYSPPRTAVAEAWVPSQRRVLYARPTELGQAFNFELIRADWDPVQFRRIISDNLSEAAQTATSNTWVLSNHDVIRHATRFGLPAGIDGGAWVAGDGREPAEDRPTGLRRAQAAIVLLLALPGSVYLYQGEELGLFEVADIPHDRLADPVWRRTKGRRKGRDGCRVPLPWTATGSSLGFGEDGAHLPQPDWFAPLSVASQDAAADSTLNLYRRSLRLRRQLRTDETLEWVDDLGPEVVHFRRTGGWQSITNFGAEPVTLPAGNQILSSWRTVDGQLPPDATAWVIPG